MLTRKKMQQHKRHKGEEIHGSDPPPRGKDLERSLILDARQWLSFKYDVLLGRIISVVLAGRYSSVQR